MASSRSYLEEEGRNSTIRGHYEKRKEDSKNQKKWEEGQARFRNYTRQKEYEKMGRGEKGHSQDEYRRDQAEQAAYYESAKKDYDECLAKGVQDDDWCREHLAHGRNLSRKLYEFTIGTPTEHKNAILLDKCLEEADKQEFLRKNGTAEDVSLARDADRKECYDTFPVSTLQTVKHYGHRGLDTVKSCVKGVCNWVSKKGGRTKRKRRRVKRKTKGRRVKRKTKRRRGKRKTKRRKKRKRRKTRKRKRRRRGGVAAGFLGEESCGEVRQHQMFDDCCGHDKAEIEAEKNEIELIKNQCLVRLRARIAEEERARIAEEERARRQRPEEEA